MTKMEVIDLLKKKRRKIHEEETLKYRKKNLNYILSIPHSGVLIPVDLADKFDINKRLLIGSDVHTDKAYDMKNGMTVLFTLSPYVVDMNRFKNGSKDKNIPAHLRFDALHRMSPSKPLLRKEYSQKEKDGLFKLYDQYHLFLEECIRKMKEKHGFALMFDCHGMSSTGPKSAPDSGKRRPDFSVGSLNKSSAHLEILSTFSQTLGERSQDYFFNVKYDYPYSGGAITRKHANPHKNIHVVQIEAKESIFMEEGIDDPYEDKFGIKKSGLKKIRKILNLAFNETFKRGKELFS